MIRDGDVLQPAGFGGHRHLLNRTGSVRCHRVHVQITKNLGLLQQLRQLTLIGPFEFPPIFSEFRRNPRQPNSRVDVFFRAARDGLVAAKNPVFVDLQAQIPGPLSQHNIVLLRSRKVLHGSAERLFRYNSQIQFDARHQSHSLLGFATLQNRRDQRMSSEAVHRGGRVRADGEDIKVAAGFLSPPTTAGSFAADHRRQQSQVGDNRFHGCFRIGD